ncbi:hypothetical protein GCM10028807_23350 [Spirosoma daeguense]
MDYNPVKIDLLPVPVTQAVLPQSSSKALIEANTIVVTEDEIRHQHIIPVFVKDNEPLISQSDFVDATLDVVSDVFRGERILMPQLRVSHAIKGRIPDARNKSAHQLQDWEKTLYYERLIFAIEIDSIQEIVEGNTLSLTIGGVKAYNLDNLHNRKGANEHFKVFIGFQNKVCTNLCVWTDGYHSDILVKSLTQLRMAIYTLLESYNQNSLLHRVKSLPDYELSEQQFALLLGRCRMYQQESNDEQTTYSSFTFWRYSVGSRL